MLPIALYVLLSWHSSILMTMIATQNAIIAVVGDSSLTYMMTLATLLAMPAARADPWLTLTRMIATPRVTSAEHRDRRVTPIATLATPPATSVARPETRLIPTRTYAMSPATTAEKPERLRTRMHPPTLMMRIITGANVPIADTRKALRTTSPEQRLQKLRHSIAQFVIL